MLILLLTDFPLQTSLGFCPLHWGDAKEVQGADGFVLGWGPWLQLGFCWGLLGGDPHQSFLDGLGTALFTYQENVKVVSRSSRAKMNLNTSSVTLILPRKTDQTNC